MPDAPLAPDLERLKRDTAEEATRAVSRFWWSEGQKIAEQVDDHAARWEMLLTAMRRVGWPS